MFKMLRTRNVPGAGQFIEGELYPSSPLMQQFAAQGLAKKVSKKVEKAKTSTSDEGSTEL